MTLRQRVPKTEAVDAAVPTVASAKKVDLATSINEQYAPFTPPKFTIKELLNAIPARCFQRSALRSSTYVLRDFVFVAALGYAAFHIDAMVGDQGVLLQTAKHGELAVKTVKAAAWMLYWWFQGLVFTGIWVIAHECGHQAFSDSKTINNAVGWVLHSALLVPYHSWRITHGRHHAATGHMTRDEVFVPKTATQVGVKSGEESSSTLEKLDDILEDAPLYVLVNLLAQQIIGWPMYLIRNASGQKHYPVGTNHFTPSSVVFEPRHFWQIIGSDIGIALAVAGLWAAARATSPWTVFCYYFVPYLLTNHWLVTITFLQHTHPALPHYRAGEFNFQRGALCTMDRNIHNFLTHHIADTHVAHHLSSKMPHYHAIEATAALKSYLGDYYMKTDEHWLTSLWSCYRQCRYVDDEGEVVFYRNAQGQSKRRVLYEADDSGVEGVLA